MSHTAVPKDGELKPAASGAETATASESALAATAEPSQASREAVKSAESQLDGKPSVAAPESTVASPARSDGAGDSSESGAASRSHSSDSLVTETGDGEEYEDSPALAGSESELNGTGRDETHELLQELETDAVDPNDGFKVLDELFTGGKINEVQYKDLQRKHKYLQSMFWVCVQNRAGLRDDIKETNAFLHELKEKARLEESSKDKRDPVEEFPEIHTVADLEGKSVDDLKRYLASFEQQRKSLDNSIYQIKFKTRHMQEEREQLKEKVDADNVSSSKIYLNSPAMLEKEVREIGVEIRVRKQEIRNLIDDIDTRERLVPQKEAKIKKLEEKIAVLQDEKEGLLPKMVLVTRDADREEKHCAKLKKQMEALGSEVSVVISELKESTDASQKIDNERNELIKAMDKEYKLLDAKSKECANLSRDTTTCRERGALLMDEKNRVEARLAMLASEIRQETLSERDMHKALERVERDLRSGEQALRAQRDLLTATKNEMDKLTKQVQQQSRQASELPALRKALQKEVDIAHGDSNMLATLTSVELQNLKRLAKERARLIRQQETLTKSLDTLSRQHSNLIRQRDTNARVLRKLSGEVERNEDELRNRITVVAKFKKKYEETEKQTKELSDRYELMKKERDEMSAQLNISLTNCDELLKKTQILRSQQDTMLSRKLELERQHAVTRQNTLKTILDKTMTQSTMNQEKDAMKELEATCDQLDMMITCNQAALNAIKETVMSDLEEYKRQVVDRNERGLLLVERDEEVCAFQEKISLQELFIERGYGQLDAMEKDICELNTIVRSEQHHIKCLRAKRAEMDTMEAGLAATRCQLQQLNVRAGRASDEMETPALRRCRHLAGPDRADDNIPAHLCRIELQLYEAELRLLERQMVDAQLERLVGRLRAEINATRADSERLAKRANVEKRAARSNYLPAAGSALPLPRPYGAFGPFKPQTHGARFRQMQRMVGRGQKQ
ncbi:coiled-coil domain-containing protein 146-like [Pollicipes pollicipes]|uniref:coiled-coil domain-containing protein 146-like n=1 Tax=Pollicipes pollicipes TaxID=41117 RepID=UPI00188547E0|nr:coiled-coil domain-containing protein 146-like [Pollicipes pollicipes]